MRHLRQLVGLVQIVEGAQKEPVIVVDVVGQRLRLGGEDDLDVMPALGIGIDRRARLAGDGDQSPVDEIGKVLRQAHHRGADAHLPARDLVGGAHRGGIGVDEFINRITAGQRRRRHRDAFGRAGCRLGSGLRHRRRRVCRIGYGQQKRRWCIVWLNHGVDQVRYCNLHRLQVAADFSRRRVACRRRHGQLWRRMRLGHDGRQGGPERCLGVRGGNRIGDPEQGIGGAQRRGQEQYAARQSQHALSRAHASLTHDVEYPLRQRAATQGHRQGGRRRPLCDQREGPGIGKPVARQRNRDLVTDQLAFGAYAAVETPQGGMIEKQFLDQVLEDIHQEVETPVMGQLVRDHRAQLYL